jgi:hypothetical protein
MVDTYALSSAPERSGGKEYRVPRSLRPDHFGALEALHFNC